MNQVWLCTVVGSIVAVAACSSGSSSEVSSGPAVDLSGDGVLDCPADAIPQDMSISVSGDSRDAVLRDGLEIWLVNGAVLDGPVDESWAAIKDGRDIALAIPEMNGDGSWTLHDVKACGAPLSGAVAIDGDLDCASGYSWTEQAGVDPDVR